MIGRHRKPSPKNWAPHLREIGLVNPPLLYLEIGEARYARVEEITHVEVKREGERTLNCYAIRKDTGLHGSPIEGVRMALIQRLPDEGDQKKYILRYSEGGWSKGMDSLGTVTGLNHFNEYILIPVEGAREIVTKSDLKNLSR